MAQEENFICPACGVEFAERSALDRHNREAHASADNAKVGLSQQALGGLHCQECGVEFTTNDQLQRHAKCAHQARV